MIIKSKNMIITTELLDNLTHQAKANPRLRMNYDLRTSAEDSSQRMLNALEPGTVVPIHRHPGSSETVCCVRGALEEVIYTEQEDGKVVESERIPLCAGSSLAVAQIPLGVWHTVDNIQEGTIIVESKDGAYAPMRPEDVIMSITKE